MIRASIVWASLMLLPLAPGAQPGFTANISTDKSEYLVGEPIRLSLLLINNGTDTVAVPGPSLGHKPVLSVQDPYGRIAFLQLSRALPLTVMSPGDSLHFFFEAGSSRSARDADRAYIRSAPVASLQEAGPHRFRVLWRPSRDSESPVVSNELVVVARISRPKERRVIAALHELDVPDNFMALPSGVAESTELDLRRRRLDRLSSSAGLLHAHVAYARARLASEWRAQTPRLVAFRREYPGFQSETVVQQIGMSAAMALWVDGDSSGIAYARTAIREQLRLHPELNANPDFMLVADQVRRRPGDVTMRIEPAKAAFSDGGLVVITVTITNTCERSVRVPGLDVWQEPSLNDFPVFMEFEDVAGERWLRKPDVLLINGQNAPTFYAGVRLEPGADLTFDWAPRRLVARLGTPDHPEGLAGELEVRVRYSFPWAWELRLGEGLAPAVESNRIRVRGGGAGEGASPKRTP